MSPESVRGFGRTTCIKTVNGAGESRWESAMYRYDEVDQNFVNARVAEFSDQVERRLAGDLTEDQFRPLRLMNGVYLQLHAYMLRIAIPYGTLSSKQL